MIQHLEYIPSVKLSPAFLHNVTDGNENKMSTKFPYHFENNDRHITQNMEYLFHKLSFGKERVNIFRCKYDFHQLRI